MKYLIASDIHGSEYYAEKLFSAYKAEKADRMILLGDILYHGPRNDLPKGYLPARVASILNSLKNEIFAVKGNCDSEVDQMVLEFPIMAEYMLMEYNSHIIFVTHGHKFNLDNLPPLKAGDVILHGHTHETVCKESDRITYINPGSVSIPKNNTNHSYIIFEDGIFTWKTIEGEEFMKFDMNNNVKL